MQRLALLAARAFALMAPVLDASGAAAHAPEPSAAVATVIVTARRPKKVDSVTVTATDWCPRPDALRHPADRAPRVVDSYPASGGVAAPGAILVRVSFDAPMSCYSEVTVEGGADDVDPCKPTGTWELPDRRSWVMPCRLEPGVTYRMRFAKVDGAGFVGLSGRAAAPFELRFTTSNAAPTPTLQDTRRADPGPPEGARVTAYVTCTDHKAPTGGCGHVRAGPPPS